MKNNIHAKLRLGLLAIWGILIIFAIIWSIEPQWLKNISSQGKLVEATEFKLRGDELLRQRDFTNALAAYSHALGILPEMQSSQIGKAISLHQLGRSAQALQIYNTLLKDNPDKPWEIYYNLASIYESQRDKENTISALEKEIEFSPDPFNSYVRLAGLYFTSSEWQTALQYYRQAFEHKPDLQNDYLSTLRTEKVTYKMDEELVKSIDSFLEKGFDQQIASQYYQKPYDDQLQENPIMARIYNNAGFCYAMMGDLKSSFPFFQTAVKIQPDNQEYRQNLAKAEHDLNEK
ncbi:MAG: tetratricopeptide repeat protein [Candidatus Cloacimonetes bacterium]|nr:tetratricopeptide repeat protein [Candidatus Cloacimonadota bacterium]